MKHVIHDLNFSYLTFSRGLWLLRMGLKETHTILVISSDKYSPDDIAKNPYSWRDVCS